MIIRNISSKVIGIGGLGDLMPDAFIEANDKYGSNSAIKRLVEMKLLAIEKSEKKKEPVVKVEKAEEEPEAEEEVPEIKAETVKKTRRKSKVVDEPAE